METELTIFFALTFVVLAGNAAVLWHIRKGFQAAAKHLDENRVYYRNVGETVRESVRAAEATSTRLAETTGLLRATVDQLGETLDRADNWARYGLAKLDFNAERASGHIRNETRILGSRLGESLYKTAAAIHGIRAAIGLIGRWQLARRAPLRKAAAVVAPLDTAIVIMQALRAFGELFRPRAGKRDRIRSHYS